MPSQPKGNRPFQDAASYNQHLAQHQAYTQAQQAQQAAQQAFRNPYLTQGQQTHLAQQQTPQSQTSSTGATAGSVGYGSPPDGVGYVQQQQQQQGQQGQQYAGASQGQSEFFFVTFGCFIRAMLISVLQDQITMRITSSTLARHISTRTHRPTRTTPTRTSNSACARTPSTTWTTLSLLPWPDCSI